MFAGPGVTSFAYLGVSVFYGWVIVAVLALFSVMAVGLAGPNIAIFIEPMSNELGWSPTTFGWAQLARLESVIIAGPLIGRALDRFGPRFIIATAGLVTSALVISMSYISGEWQLIAIFAVTGLLGMGQVADLFVNAPLAKWFVRRRGLAMGIALSGTPLGVAIFYPLLQLTIDAIGWRDTWRIFGIAGAVVIVPAALLLLRRQPEDLGMLPDGDAPRPLNDIDFGIDASEVSWSRSEAVRHPSFWLMIVGFTLFTYGWSTITIFRVPHFVERGLDPTLVAFSIAVDALVAIVVSVSLGRLSERVAPRYILALGVGGLIVSASSLIIVDNVAFLFAANIGYGFGFQTGHVAQSVMWANYFGRRHLGEIRGLTLPLTFGVGAAAFPVTGLIRESTGVYTPAWVVAIAVLVVSAGLLVSIKPPRKVDLGQPLG